jgi:CRISPR/Cas system-associated endonuclease/helicase Cas3
LAHSRIQAKVRKAIDVIQEAEEDGDEALLKLSQLHLKKLESKRTAANEESNFPFKVLLVRGAKEFDALIDSSENNKKTKMTKQAFLIRSAIRMHAGFYSAM